MHGKQRFCSTVFLLCIALVHVIKKDTFGSDVTVNGSQKTRRCLGVMLNLSVAGRTFLPGLHLWGFSWLRTSCTLFISSLNWIPW